MLKINQIKLNIDEEKDEVISLKEKLTRKLRLQSADMIRDFRIIRKSVDARKNEIYYTYSVVFSLDKNKENNILKYKSALDIHSYEEREYKFTDQGLKPLENGIVIVGMGPAGLFCAYMLALNGYRPVVLEQGQCMEERIKKVEDFFSGKELDEHCNIQFGEGGAGTFSDGKLNTLVKDKSLRQSFVLKTFIENGAPEDIGYLAKPHIGTDRLRTVIVNMRKKLIEMGADIRFGVKVCEVITDNGRLTGIKTVRVGKDMTANTDGVKNATVYEDVKCDALVLAIGHSSRDTFRMLYDKGFDMKPKAFAVGVRIEHKQEMIGRAQYGEDYLRLPAASYKLTYTAKDGRGVYTFCMCPGGSVVNASSVKGMCAVNGMSNYKRDAENANSAVIVTVDEKDFGGSGPLSGIEFQERLEKAAFLEGGGKVPVQTFRDFLDKKTGDGIFKLNPSVLGGCKSADINKCLPDYICDDIKEAVQAFDKKIHGFADSDSLLYAVESRTSSPVRIVRDEESLEALKAENDAAGHECYEGIYPCGEGAGYAGGIMSAAMDGIKVAEAIAGKFKAC